MSLRPLICTALLVTLLGACKSADFSGSSKATGSAEPLPKANPDGSPAHPDAAAPGTGGNAGPGSPGSTSPSSSDNSPSASTDENNNGSTPGSNNSAANPPSSSSDPSAPANPANPSTPGTPPTQTPNGPTCSAGHHGVGARIAFLIDNSGSNGGSPTSSGTDCPNRVSAGLNAGAATYTCGGQTNREVAVLSAYDTLQKFAAANSSDALAVSQLSISSFPTATDQYAGYQQQTAGWVRIDGSTRSSIAGLMQFARSPVGATPYGAAMSAATAVFHDAPSDGRRNVAILVSDGQPTDRNPAGVLAQATALKNAGVTVIVLDYNGSPASSVATDTAQMKDFEASYSKNPKTGQPNGNHWYTSNYANFDAYIAALLGTSTQPALAASLTSSGSVLSVQNSAALTAALNSLVSTSTVACTP